MNNDFENDHDTEVNGDFEVEDEPEKDEQELEDIESPEPAEPADHDEENKEPEGPVFTPPSFGGLSLQD